MKGLHIATAGDGGSGIVFYQDTPFVSSGNNQLIIPNKSLQNLTDDGYKFISKALTKILFNRFHGFSRQAVSGVDFEREIIILPCYEDNSISTSKMAELYQKSVIKSKVNQITEREREQSRKQRMRCFNFSRQFKNINIYDGIFIYTH